MPNQGPSFDEGSISLNTFSLEEKGFRGYREERKSQASGGRPPSLKDPNSFIGGRSPYGSRYSSRRTQQETSFNLPKTSNDGRSYAKSIDSQAHEGTFHSEKQNRRSRKTDSNRDAHEIDNSDGSRFIKGPSNEARTPSENTQSSSYTWGSEFITPVTPEIEESSKHKKGDSKAADSKAVDSKAADSKTTGSKKQAGPSATVQASKRPINDFQRRLSTLEKLRPRNYDNIRGMLRSPRSYAEKVRQPQKIVEKPTAVRKEIRLYPDLSKSQPGRLDCRTPCHVKGDNYTYPAEIIHVRRSRLQSDSLRNIFVPESSENSRRFTTSFMGSQFSARNDDLRSPYRRTYDSEHHRYRYPPQSVITIGQPELRNVSQNKIQRNNQLRGKFA